MGPLENLLHQAGPRDKNVVHFAVQAVGQASKGVERDGSTLLCLLQLTGPLRRHTQSFSQRLGTHAHGQSDGLCPAAPGRGTALQFREIAKLAVKFGQAGEIQAVFQSSQTNEATGWLPDSGFWATGSFPFGRGHASQF